jgi:hypothetical protein
MADLTSKTESPLDVRVENYRLHWATDGGGSREATSAEVVMWAEIKRLTVERDASREAFLNSCARAVKGPQYKIQRLREALECLLPGLVLDLRYATDDDDKDAMRSRIETVQDALAGTAVETKPARDADHCDYPDCEQHWTYVATEQKKLLSEARAYVLSFASITKHPTAPADAHDLVKRMDVWIKNSQNETAQSTTPAR